MAEPEAFAGKMPFLAELGPLDDVPQVAQAVRDLHSALTTLNRTIYGDARLMIRDRLPAIDDAVEAAEAVANSKAHVFTEQPVPPYAVGDLWPDVGSQLLMLCTTARAEGAYEAGDWESIGAVDDLTIERNESAELQVKDAGISTAKIAAGAVSGHMLAFDNTGLATGNAYYYKSSAAGSFAVSGAEVMLVFMTCFDSTSATPLSYWFRLQYSSDGSTWVNLLYNEANPGNPNTAEPANEGDESNPRYESQLVGLHIHTPTAGAAYYRLQVKTNYAAGYMLYTNRGIMAVELKR